MAHGTIEEVLEDLTRVIDRARANQSPQGYFAALYLTVTREIAQKIEGGYFEDGPRMERFDVNFASRYLKANELFNRGESPGRAWGIAYGLTTSWWPIVLQHLLAAMAAHIHLDLAVAAAQTAPGPALPPMKQDFNKINVVLASKVGSVERDLAAIWPTLRFVNWVAGWAETKIIDLGMDYARDQAWAAAMRLSVMDPEEQRVAIAELDKQAAAEAGLVANPGCLVTPALQLVRLGERGSVSDKIALLER